MLDDERNIIIFDFWWPNQLYIVFNAEDSIFDDFFL